MAYGLDHLSTNGIFCTIFIGGPTKRPVANCLAQKRPETKPTVPATQRAAMKRTDHFDHLH